MYLFTRYLPFLPPPRPLSSPVMEANLSPADVLMSNGCGNSFYNASSRKNRGRVYLSPCSTEPSAPQPDKAPRQSSTAARPHSLQWMGQSRDSTWPTALTILPSSHRPCCHTTPGKSILISPKTWAISQSAHYYWIMHRFFLKKVLHHWSWFSPCVDEDHRTYWPTKAV